ncbi:dynamin family protein [Bacteroides sp. ET336]|uniref:dynamin family protein n=1 Tax=Bacteroides sp. ET336 TaxID=2972459 RepID=UPI0021AC41B3|nr:dynamin family protein [Bacteroides sp. ET336]MCR8894821.1 dynamin family protein [Bacteroides sp. ET336]MDN0059317.1 dynamin family protein [Bacteroides caecigallinarum]
MNGNSIISRTQSLLDDFSVYIDNSVWREKYSFGLKALQQELTAPCVLAIAGKVKAGKSFLVNALLGVDLAMTGTTETTATINIFKSGKPPYKDKPILCQYIDGNKEWKEKSFLDSLQGTTKETLALTSKIDRLIFYIDNNPVLEHVTLVDTPGIGAEVGEDGDSHQIHTDAYFKLRSRHQEETVNLSNSADAMIYLFNTVPTETDKEFLDTLYNGGQGLTSLNGIGVLSKIDKDIHQIDNLQKFKKLFELELFTIVPTSATIFKYTPSIAEAEVLKNKLQNGFNTEKGFLLAMGAETAFLHPNLPMCNLSVEEREAILSSYASKDLSWSTFALIAKELYYTNDIEKSIYKLQQLAGISKLKNVINDHFFKRARLLRCNKILTEINKLLKDIQYSEYYLTIDFYAREKETCILETEKLSPNVRNIVQSLIRNYIPKKEDVILFKQRIAAFKTSIEELQEQLSLINKSYLAYQKIISNQNSFSQAELDELRDLLTGQEISLDCQQRQKYWTAVYNCSAPNSTKQFAASVARALYNDKLRKL